MPRKEYGRHHFFKFQAMKRFCSSANMFKKMSPRCLRDGYERIKGRQLLMMDRPRDLFINHRGVDTKKTFAGLLFQHLSLLDVSCFLDVRSLQPGEQLPDNIRAAIRGCKVGVAVLSPRYCESTHCLHELALMMEMKKRVIPIFYDVKPSQLHILSQGACTSRDLQRYNCFDF